VDRQSRMKRDQIDKPEPGDLVEVYAEQTWTLWEVLNLTEDGSVKVRIWEKNKFEDKILTRESWGNALILEVTKGKCQIKVIPNARKQ